MIDIQKYGSMKTWGPLIPVLILLLASIQYLARPFWFDEVLTLGWLELDFFRIEGDNLMMGSMERKQLEASPTYVGLCAKKDTLLEMYHNSLRIAGARIQSLRKR